MNIYSGRTNKKLLELYEQYGKVATIKYCRSLLKDPTNKDDFEFMSGVHGEICETVLEILLKDYIKENNRQDWYITKGLVLPIPGTDYTTEIDMILFTPQTIFVFECKCYGGEKTITGDCTINRPGKAPFDVFKQNVNHLKWLDTYCRPYYKQIGTSVPYTVSYFRFDSGTLVDTRKKKSKDIFPITEVETLYDLINSRTSEPGKSWNMSVVREIKRYEKMRDKLSVKHLKQVTKK